MLTRNDSEVITSSDNEEQDLMLVEVMDTEPTLMARELALQGQVEPLRSVSVRAQTGGTTDTILVSKGERVEENQPLVKLDEGGRRNSLAEAQAFVQSSRSEQEAAQALQRQRLQSKVQLEQADAALETALARLASVELDIERTTVRAPFAGVINELAVEKGKLIEHGDLVAELIDDSAFKVSASVSQHSLSQLSSGQNVTVQLITGETLAGTITFISAAADPQTRSFDVEALVQNSSDTIASGVSATMNIPVEEVQATFISPSAMSLGSDGEPGVKAVDENEQVVFFPVELVSSTLDGAWVTGIPAQSRVITLGQGPSHSAHASVVSHGERNSSLYQHSERV